MQGFQTILPLLINGAKMPSDASIFPEAVQFFPIWTRMSFRSSTSIRRLCSLQGSVVKERRKNGFRDIYNSSSLFNTDQSLEDLLSRAQNGDTRQPTQGYAVHVLYRARRIQKGGADLADTYPNAADQLGMLHFHPTGSFKKDIPRSIEFFETAAKAGSCAVRSASGTDLPDPGIPQLRKSLQLQQIRRGSADAAPADGRPENLSSAAYRSDLFCDLQNTFRGGLQC